MVAQVDDVRIDRVRNLVEAQRDLPGIISLSTGRGIRPRPIAEARREADSTLISTLTYSVGGGGR
jgi:hypothetical protein